ncbi:MAG: hypothetical protein AB7S68_04850 [Polyangiaceae bacterium]
MKRVLGLSVSALLVLGWGCSSDEGGGGNGGSGGTAGSSAAGSSGAGAGGTGSSGGSGGSSGGSAGTGGVTDAGMDGPMLDVYVNPDCVDVCDKGQTACSFDAMSLEECKSGCTEASLGDCADQLNAFVTCVNAADASSISCFDGLPTSSDCDSELQTLGGCLGD